MLREKIFRKKSHPEGELNKKLFLEKIAYFFFPDGGSHCNKELFILQVDGLEAL
jgi:hypothetical protein